LGEFFRFLVVGGAGGLGYLFIASFLREAVGTEAFVASLIAYGLMVVPIYLAHRAITFGSSVRHQVGLVKYVTVQGAAMVIAALAAHVATIWLRTPFEFVAANIVSAAFSYFAMKIWAFSG
jgi:putative flippase GtrA